MYPGIIIQMDHISVIICASGNRLEKSRNTDSRQAGTLCLDATNQTLLPP